jgi:hypothetical protein
VVLVCAGVCSRSWYGCWFDAVCFGCCC